MSYVHGEILELAGLVIKTTYDDGTAENRNFSDFLEYSGDINKVNHTVLSHAEHDGFVLKASIAGKEVTIGAITVTAQQVSIRQNDTRDTRYGIFLENAIVSNAAKISVIIPEPAQITLKILDNLGNTVHTVETQCLRLQSATPCEIVWNLTNNAGRFVANGTYLVIAEAKSANGKIYRYSARIGVNR